MSYTYAAAPQASMCFCAGSNAPRLVMTPCPQRCAIVVEGVYYPATILNAPRMGTVPLPEHCVYQLPTPPPSPQSATVANRRLR